MISDRMMVVLIIAMLASGAAWAWYTWTQRSSTSPSTVGEEKEPIWVEYSRFIFAVSIIVILIKLLDLAIVLLSLTVATGVIWGGYKLYQRYVSRQQTGGTAIPRKEPALVEFSRFLFPVVLIVMVVRSFLAEPFQIPSESMLPTLEKGDYILVNRYAYGLRLPVFHTKILDISTPKRGDVIVFRFPEDPSIDYIKRVVGVPGDRLRYMNKKLYLNGELVAQIEQGNYRKQPDKKQHLEKLPDIDHSILTDPATFLRHHFLSENREVEVPVNAYFVMGDNRDNSKDSREWGFVPDAHLKGRAFFIWFSWDETGIKWERIGNSIE